mgnify:CR=1 FL=1
MAKLWIDNYVFQWIKKQLTNATPDQIVAFYVDKFIFHNEGYLEFLQKEYNLPNDILKMHAKIIAIA